MKKNAQLLMFSARMSRVMPHDILSKDFFSLCSQLKNILKKKSKWKARYICSIQLKNSPFALHTLKKWNVALLEDIAEDGFQQAEFGQQEHHINYTYSVSYLSNRSGFCAESLFCSMGKRVKAQSLGLLTGHCNITSPSLLIHRFSFQRNLFNY